MVLKVLIITLFFHIVVSSSICPENRKVISFMHRHRYIPEHSIEIVEPTRQFKRHSISNLRPGKPGVQFDYQDPEVNDERLPYVVIDLVDPNSNDNYLNVTGFTTEGTVDTFLLLYTEDGQADHTTWNKVQLDEQASWPFEKEIVKMSKLKIIPIKIVSHEEVYKFTFDIIGCSTKRISCAGDSNVLSFMHKTEYIPDESISIFEPKRPKKQHKAENIRPGNIGISFREYDFEPVGEKRPYVIIDLNDPVSGLKFLDVSGFSSQGSVDVFTLFYAEDDDVPIHQWHNVSLGGDQGWPFQKDLVRIARLKLMPAFNSHGAAFYKFTFDIIGCSETRDPKDAKKVLVFSEKAKINTPWNDDLSDPSSLLFKEYSEAYTDFVRYAAENSDAKNDFISVKVDKFFQGSTYIKYTTHFSKSESSSVGNDWMAIQTESQNDYEGLPFSIDSISSEVSVEDLSKEEVEALAEKMDDQTSTPKEEIETIDNKDESISVSDKNISPSRNDTNVDTGNSVVTSSNDEKTEPYEANIAPSNNNEEEVPPTSSYENTESDPDENKEVEVEIVKKEEIPTTSSNENKESDPAENKDVDEKNNENDLDKSHVKPVVPSNPETPSNPDTKSKEKKSDENVQPKAVVDDGNNNGTLIFPNIFLLIACIILSKHT